MGLAPIRFSAGACGEVALFRLDDADIALGELFKTGIAIALIEALFCLPIAMDAMDFA
jgi:hypothetical protein